MASAGEGFRGFLEGAPALEIPSDGTREELHIYVVGPPGDPLTVALYREALALAGGEGVDLVDPEDPSGAALMEENHLPDPGRPYAQACVGLLCFAPAFTTEDLRSAWKPDDSCFAFFPRDEPAASRAPESLARLRMDRFERAGG